MKGHACMLLTGAISAVVPGGMRGGPSNVTLALLRIAASLPAASSGSRRALQQGAAAGSSGTRTSFTGNQAVYQGGGAVLVQHMGLLVDGASFSGNQARLVGGALYVSSAAATEVLAVSRIACCARCTYIHAGVCMPSQCVRRHTVPKPHHACRRGRRAHVHMYTDPAACSAAAALLWRCVRIGWLATRTTLSCHGHGVGQADRHHIGACTACPGRQAPGLHADVAHGDGWLQAGVVATAEQSTTLSARITGADFTNNHADSIGGAVYSITSNTTIGPEVTFTGNTAGDDTLNEDS